MATEFSPPLLTEKTDYELWKLETQAWTVVTDISQEKQAVAVALNLPGDDKRMIKEKVFDELGLSALNSENGMSNLFDFLDRYLLEDELMSSWRRFEDFEKFERKHGQNIRKYVYHFDLKYSKVEKLHVKLPSELLALKLLSKANITEQERMMILTGINFKDKKNMFRDAKQSLLKFMGDLCGRKDVTGLVDVKLEPAWRKSISSSTSKRHVQQGYNNYLVKKNMNPLGTDGKLLLCHSCGSYQHFVAECPHSWENMVKSKSSEPDGKLGDQNSKSKGKDNRSTELMEPVDTGSVQVANIQLIAEDISQLTTEIQNLEADIKEIKAVLDRELQSRKEKAEILCHVENISKVKAEGQQEKSDTSLHELRQFMKTLQKEDLSRSLKEIKEKLSAKKFCSENNQVDRWILEKGTEICSVIERSQGRMTNSGTYEIQDNTKETNINGTCGMQQTLDSHNRTKQRLLRKAKEVRQKLHTKDSIDQTKELFCCEREQLNNIGFQVIAWCLGCKISHDINMFN